MAAGRPPPSSASNSPSLRCLDHDHETLETLAGVPHGLGDDASSIGHTAGHGSTPHNILTARGEVFYDFGFPMDQGDLGRAYVAYEVRFGC